ncbi:uncharacterized protein LOC116146125 [Pistacia vera]|uniref:uncharacterized protein LOC116146125 n=1 Tax=Pistacia vera TaxID=55513 RepID=UPI0012639060|nr:uncharacterized protein LOC116146125 [Pistacia vera]
MATSATASGGAPKLRHTSNAATHRRLNPTKKHMGSTKFLVNFTNHSPVSSLQRPFTVLASNNSQPQDQDSSSQEDVNYLWKIGAGSFVGAAVIKYGSILFPDITRPNIIQALIMVSTPCIIAVWILIKQSRVEQ